MNARKWYTGLAWPVMEIVLLVLVTVYAWKSEWSRATFDLVLILAIRQTFYTEQAHSQGSKGD